MQGLVPGSSRGVGLGWIREKSSALPAKCVTWSLWTRPVNGGQQPWLSEALDGGGGLPLCQGLHLGHSVGKPV